MRRHALARYRRKLPIESLPDMKALKFAISQKYFAAQARTVAEDDIGCLSGIFFKKVLTRGRQHRITLRINDCSVAQR